MIGSLYPHLNSKQPPPLNNIMADIGVMVGGPFGHLVAGLFEGLADAAYQGVAVELGWQDHFSLRAAFTSAIETSLSIGILGIHGVSPSEIFASLGQMELQAVVEKTALIAVTGQLTEMATGLRDKFDFGEVLTQVGTAVVMHAVAPVEDKLLNLKSGGFEEKLVTGETSGLVGGELNHLVNHQKVDIITITGSTIGSSVGSTLGAKWSEDVKDWKNHNAETPSSYQQMQKDSANNNTSNSYQSSQNPERNKSGFFSNTSNANKHIQVSSSHKTNWLTDSPKSILEDGGVNDFDDNENTSPNVNKNAHSYTPVNRPRDSGAVESVSPELWALGATDGIKLISTGIKLFENGVESLFKGWGFFEKGSLNNATNHIDLLRLNKDLQARQISSMFNETGGLTQETIEKSRVVTYGTKLNNPQLQQELLSRGGNLEDWGKYKTPQLSSPSGDFEMHFYHNPVTNDVYYGFDYKAVFSHQGNYNLELMPKFSMQPWKPNL